MWLTGWIWNAFVVVTACTLAWVSGKRFGKPVGVLVLLMVLLSHAFYDGFSAMYWKTYAGLFFMVLSFHFLEKKSLWVIPLGLLTVITHHQTGLLFGLVLCSWWLASFLLYFSEHPEMRSLLSSQQALLKKVEGSRQLLSPYQTLIGLVAGFAVFVLGLIWYIPIWEETVMRQIPALLDVGGSVKGGNFPEPLFYLRVTGLLLLLGGAGFFWSFRKEQWTVWQLAVIWSAVFVLFKLFFYRRFFLQMDFFLLPFAALAVYDPSNMATVKMFVFHVTAEPTITYSTNQVAGGEE